jgi:hypothetical protein
MREGEDGDDGRIWMRMATRKYGMKAKLSY